MKQVVIVSHLLPYSLIHTFSVKTEPQFPICNVPGSAFVLSICSLMYSPLLPSESFGPPPLYVFIYTHPTFHPVCWALTHNLAVSTSSCLPRCVPNKMSSAFPPTALGSALQHFPSSLCHIWWVLICTYSGVMTFSVYFIHGPQLFAVTTLSAKNPINLSAISAHSDNGAYPGF